MLTFKEIKKLAQETTNETPSEENTAVAKAMTRLLPKIWKSVEEKSEPTKDGITSTVTIYTDGSAPDNREKTGRGGWCAILVSGKNEKVISGGLKDTTNNRAELTAAIEGLKALKVSCLVTIVTDSEYLSKGAQKYLAVWKSKNWKGSSGDLVKNIDLWTTLDKEMARHIVSWEWVRGHVGHPYNERCDVIARKEADKVK